MALGQAPFDLPFLSLAALAGFLHLIHLQPIRRAFWLGWLAGVGYFATAIHWIVEPFLVDIAQHGWMAPFALLFMAAGLALFWAVPVAATARLTGWQHGLALACAWTLSEAARSVVFTGFPWALLGYIWVETPIAQAAAFVGPHMLGFATILLGAALSGTFQRPLRAVLPLLLLGLAWLGLSQRPPPQADLTDVTIRLVQPNAAQHLKWQPEMMQTFFDRQIAATSAPGSPDLVVWPEAAVPYLLHERPDLNAHIAKAAGPDTRVFLGIRHRVQDDTGTRWFNSAALLAPDGAVAAQYDKHHLVPFGEFLPFRPLFDRFGLQALAANAGIFFAGEAGPAVIESGIAPPFQPLICYEAIFPNEILRGDNRPAWLLHVTNDAWFGNFSGPFQHLAQVRMRAIEQGLPVARAANTGISAMIDPYGRVLASLPFQTGGYLDNPLPEALPPTLYSKAGDWPFLTALAALLLTVVLMSRPKASEIGHGP